MYLDYSSRDEYADINASFAEKYIEILYIERLEEPQFRLDYIKSRAQHVKQLQELQLKDLEGNLGWLSYLHGIILSREQMEERMQSLLKCSTLYMVEFDLEGCSPEDAFSEEGDEEGMKQGPLREAIRHTYMDFLLPCERVIESLQNHFVRSRPSKICSFSQFDYVQKLLYQELYPTSKGPFKTHAGLVMMPIKFPRSFKHAIGDNCYPTTDIKLRFHKWTGLKTGGSLFKLKGEEIRPSLVPNRIVSVWSVGKPEQLFKHYSKLFALGTLSFTKKDGDETTIIMKELEYRAEKRNEKVSQIGTTLPPRSLAAVGSDKEDKRLNCQNNDESHSIVKSRKVSFAVEDPRSDIKENGANCSRSLHPAPNVKDVVHRTDSSRDSDVDPLNSAKNKTKPSEAAKTSQPSVSNEADTLSPSSCVEFTPEDASSSRAETASRRSSRTASLTAPKVSRVQKTFDASLDLNVKPDANAGNRVKKPSGPRQDSKHVSPLPSNDRKSLNDNSSACHETEPSPGQERAEISSSRTDPLNCAGTSFSDVHASFAPDLRPKVSKPCPRSHEINASQSAKQVYATSKGYDEHSITGRSSSAQGLGVSSSASTRKLSDRSYRTLQANKQAMLIDGVELELSEIERDILSLLEQQNSEKKAAEKLNPPVERSSEKQAAKIDHFNRMRDEFMEHEEDVLFSSNSMEPPNSRDGVVDGQLKMAVAQSADMDSKKAGASRRVRPVEALIELIMRSEQLATAQSVEHGEIEVAQPLGIGQKPQLTTTSDDHCATGANEAAVFIKDDAPKPKCLLKIEASRVPDLSPGMDKSNTVTKAASGGLEVQKDSIDRSRNGRLQDLPQSRIPRSYASSQSFHSPPSSFSTQQKSDERKYYDQKMSCDDLSPAEITPKCSLSSTKSSSMTNKHQKGVTMVKSGTGDGGVTELGEGSRAEAATTSSSQRGRRTNRKKERKGDTEAQRVKDYVESDTLPLNIRDGHNDRSLAYKSSFRGTSIDAQVEGIKCDSKMNELQTGECLALPNKADDSQIGDSQPVGDIRSSDAIKARSCHCHLKENCRNPFHEKLPEASPGGSISTQQRDGCQVEAINDQAGRRNGHQSLEASRSSANDRIELSNSALRQEPILSPSDEYEQHRSHLYPGGSTHSYTMNGCENECSSKYSKRAESQMKTPLVSNSFGIMASESSIRNFIYGAGHATSVFHDAEDGDQESVIVSSHLFPPIGTSQAPCNDSVKSSKRGIKSIDPSGTTGKSLPEALSILKRGRDDCAEEEGDGFCYDSRDAIKSCELSTIDQIFGKHGFHQIFEREANVKSLDQPESMFSFCSGPTVGSPISSQIDAAVNEHLSNCAKGLYKGGAGVRQIPSSPFAESNEKNLGKSGMEPRVHGSQAQKNSSHLPDIFGKQGPDSKRSSKNRSLRFANKVKSVVSPHSGYIPNPSRPIKKEKRKLTYDELYPALSDVRFRDFVKFKAHKFKEDLKYYSDMVKLHVVDT
ncbi:LAFA_0G13828g1_1 [Lachancea sp. 'fantastica']|nr:LAFA_0G13828g1_1 [Lachancea sp. 'fantastica']